MTIEIKIFSTLKLSSDIDFEEHKSYSPFYFCKGVWDFSIAHFFYKESFEVLLRERVDTKSMDKFSKACISK